MKQDSLVILKGKATLISEASQTTFVPNKHYRCIELTEGGVSQFLVYGVVFDKDAFDSLFFNLYDLVTEQWSNNGLLPMMKPLSKAKFIDVLDVHTYGRGKNKLFIGFVGDTLNGLFAFQPLFSGDSKSKYLTHAYKMYQDFLNGNMTDIDEEMIQRGNSGVPLSFGDIYFKKEWNANNEKNEIYC